MGQLKSTVKRVISFTPYEVRRVSKATAGRDYDPDHEVERAVERVRDHSMVARAGLVSLYQQVSHCERSGLDGSFVECGVWKGGASALMAIANLTHGATPRHLHLFDSFIGIPEPIADVDGRRAVREVGGSQHAQGRLQVAYDYAPRGGPGSEQEVRELLSSVSYPQEFVHTHKGWFQETVPAIAASIGPIAILRLDGDFYESTMVCLEGLYESVVPGGFVVIDDYGAYDGCRQAVDEFIAQLAPQPFLNYVNSEIRYIIK